MNNLQEVFDRLQVSKKEVRDLKSVYRDALAGDAKYQEVKDKLEATRAAKKQLEDSLKAEFRAELDKLEQLKMSMADDAQLLSDLAVNHLTKGEAMKVTDQYSGEYAPIFSVKFKKIN